MLKTEFQGLEMRNTELWDGWFFYDGVIFDDNKNRYTQDDILKSWRSAQIVNQFEGSRATILSLRNRLDERIAEYSCPTLCLIYEGKNGVVEKVYKIS